MTRGWRPVLAVAGLIVALTACRVLLARYIEEDPESGPRPLWTEESREKELKANRRIAALNALIAASAPASPTAAARPATPSASIALRVAPPPLEPRPPETPPGPGPWNEPAPPLRPVTGVVCDAVSGAPVPDAWVAWRLPEREMRERILADLPQDASGFTMITDLQGRFRLDRLPDGEAVSWQVHAVARGYAPGSAPAGLGREVAIELRPLAPGEAPPDDAPPLVALRAIVLGPGGPVRGVDVCVVGATLRKDLRPRTGDDGRFSVDVPAGSYAVYVERGDSFRTVGDPVEAGGPEARLWLEDRDVDVRVTVSVAGVLPGASEPLRDRDIGLVFFESGAPDLLALPSVAGEPGVFAGRVPPGRAAVFQDVTLVGELNLPGDARAHVEVRWFDADLVFELPAVVGDSEVIRVDAALIPAVIARDRIVRRLYEERQRFRVPARRGGPPRRVPLALPGEYVLTGVTDLGPLEVPVTIRGGGEVRIPIPAR